jgi:hypothetical protein
MISKTIISGATNVDNISTIVVPAVSASDFGNFCPNSITPYRTTGTKNKDIWIFQSTALASTSPVSLVVAAMKKEANPPSTKPAGQPA